MNLRADPTNVLQDFMVLEAQNANVDKRKVCGAQAVVVQATSILVLCAIYFDRETRFGTIEIQNKSVDWVLSPKFETRERSSP